MNTETASIVVTRDAGLVYAEGSLRACEFIINRLAHEKRSVPPWLLERAAEWRQRVRDLESRG